MKPSPVFPSRPAFHHGLYFHQSFRPRRPRRLYWGVLVALGVDVVLIVVGWGVLKVAGVL